MRWTRFPGYPQDRDPGRESHDNSDRSGRASSSMTYDIRTVDGIVALIHRAQDDTAYVLDDDDVLDELRDHSQRCAYSQTLATDFMQQSVAIPRACFIDPPYAQWALDVIRNLYAVHVYIAVRDAQHRRWEHQRQQEREARERRRTQPPRQGQTPRPMKRQTPRINRKGGR